MRSSTAAPPEQEKMRERQREIDDYVNIHRRLNGMQERDRKCVRGKRDDNGSPETAAAAVPATRVFLFRYISKL